jgi:ribosomal protein S18
MGYDQCIFRSLRCGVQKFGDITNWLKSDKSYDRGRCFELIAAFLTETVPWDSIKESEKELRDLTIRDIGIDSANETTAVQSKFHSIDVPVNWAEISKFLCAAKLSDYPYEICKLCINKGVRVGGIRKQYYDIIEIDDDAIKSVEDRYNEWALTIVVEDEPEKITLRKCQVDALKILDDKITEIMLYEDEDDSDDALSISSFDKQRNEVILQMCCGSGKSDIVLSYITENIDSFNKICIFVPTILLMEQFANVARDRYNLEPVCIGTGHITTIEDIEESQLFICVYNSAELLQDESFDIIFIDEGHHLRVPEEIDLNEFPLKKIILSIDTKVRVYLSATIDDSDYSYGIRDAINDKIISEYDVTILEHSGDRVSPEAIYNLLSRHPCWTCVLAYFSRCDEAERYANEITKLGIKSAFMDGKMSKTKRNLILTNLRDGEIRLLCSVDVLGEGIDIVCADTCFLVDNKYSDIGIIQACGRVLRKSIGKEMSHIVINKENEKEILTALFQYDPHIIDCCRKKKGMIYNAQENDDVEVKEFSERTFDRIQSYNLLDERWMKNFEILKRYAEEHGKLPIRKMIIDGAKVGSWINVQRRNKEKMSDERRKKLETLPLWKWKTIEITKREGTKDEIWDENFKILKKYVDEHGKLPIRKIIIDRVKIGSWIHNQRGNKEKMSDERRKKLETLPLWKWKIIEITKREGTKDEVWDENFEILKKYVDEHGKLPTNRMIIDNIKISDWISHQRKNKEKMSDERRKKLETLPLWKWEEFKRTKREGTKDEVWDENFKILKKYVDEHGKLPIQKMIIDSVKIGNWISRQRGNKEKMSDERRKKLETLPLWKWKTIEITKREGTKDEIWDENFKILKKYAEEHGKLPTYTMIIDSVKIGIWITNQRGNKEKMSDERRKKLETIDGWYWHEK